MKEVELEVKKSRFIARAYPLKSREHIKSILAETKEAYPDARHYCWAYLLGNPSSASSAGMSDDGEPAGTAGKPILNVIGHKSVGDVLVVVIRYFGGVKLGAGGLVRAYSAATQAVFEILPLSPFIHCQVMIIECEYQQEQKARYLVQQVGGRLESYEYKDKVQLRTLIPDSEVKLMQNLLDNQGICWSSENDER